MLKGDQDEIKIRHLAEKQQLQQKFRRARDPVNAATNLNSPSKIDDQISSQMSDPDPDEIPAEEDNF